MKAKSIVKVVLVHDVPGLGKAGESKDVAPGYARNFLLPRKVAVEATSSQLKLMQDKKTREERQQQKKVSDATSIADRLSAIPLTFKVKVGEQHRLYGSISAKEIAEALQWQAKITVDRRWVQLEEPIRAVGDYDVSLRIAANVNGVVKVSVQPE